MTAVAIAQQHQHGSLHHSHAVLPIAPLLSVQQPQPQQPSQPQPQQSPVQPLSVPSRPPSAQSLPQIPPSQERRRSSDEQEQLGLSRLNVFGPLPPRGPRVVSLQSIVSNFSALSSNTTSTPTSPPPGSPIPLSVSVSTDLVQLAAAASAPVSAVTPPDGATFAGRIPVFMSAGTTDTSENHSIASAGATPPNEKESERPRRASFGAQDPSWDDALLADNVLHLFVRFQRGLRMVRTGLPHVCRVLVLLGHRSFRLVV